MELLRHDLKRLQTTKKQIRFGTFHTAGIFYFLVLTTNLEVSVVVPILQIWKLRFRKANYLPKDLPHICLWPQPGFFLACCLLGISSSLENEPAFRLLPKYLCGSCCEDWASRRVKDHRSGGPTGGCESGLCLQLKEVLTGDCTSPPLG